jgi:hypothetical protein
MRAGDCHVSARVEVNVGRQIGQFRSSFAANAA